MHRDIESDARAFALRAHGEQRYGVNPYEVHLAAVRGVLAEFGYAGELLVAAWLHDTLEDTDTPREAIRAEFGPAVEALVWAVTGIGEDRKARNESAYAKIRELPEAATLKLADRLANCRASARDNPELLAKYRAEMPRFSEALAGLGDPRLWDALRRVLATD